MNVVGTVNVLLECAARQTPQSRMRVIYASSVAACSCDADHAEGDAPVYYMARSSYGTHKAIGMVSMAWGFSFVIRGVLHGHAQGHRIDVVEGS